MERGLRLLVDFAIWQRSDALVPLLDKSCDYWRAQLREGALPSLDLPLDFQRPAAQTFNGETVAVKIPADVTAKLEALGQQNSCTLYQTMLALWGLLLCRHAGQDEVVIGSP